MLVADSKTVPCKRNNFFVNCLLTMLMKDGGLMKCDGSILMKDGGLMKCDGSILCFGSSAWAFPLLQVS